MSRRSGYEEYLRKHTALQTDPRGDLWTNQESRYVKPFQIFGNVWYEGTVGYAPILLIRATGSC